MKIKLIIFVIAFITSLSAQEVNIVEYLKAIEDGEVATAINGLNTLKRTNPNDPSVIFLDAVLTEDGEAAVTKYRTIYEQHPKSNYADAALYRVFSYYYSLGIYQRAEGFLASLKSEYPNSPYIKSADRTIPDVDDIAVTEAEAPQNIQPTPSTEETYGFTIQAGAFLNIDNAKSLLNAIQQDGYPSELGTKSVGGTILNVVTFGHLKNEEDGQPLISYLKNKFDLNGRVISVE